MTAVAGSTCRESGANCCKPHTAAASSERASTYTGHVALSSEIRCMYQRTCTAPTSIVPRQREKCREAKREIFDQKKASDS